MLDINEIFGPTIQGEGKYCGQASVFIRFGGCNLSCEGFKVEYETPNGIKKFGCDTYYAADSSFKKMWTKYNDYKQIIAVVDKLLTKSNISYKIDVVITGGEPLLYWKNQEFQKLLKYYIQNNHRVTIETNASLPLSFEYEYQKKLVFSMSVKLSNSLEKQNKRINKESLIKIISQTRESYLKFVINKIFISQAKHEIEQILDDLPPVDVYLMPMGDTIKEVKQNSEAIIQLAIEKNYIFTDRLHIRVWNNKRGV